MLELWSNISEILCLISDFTNFTQPQPKSSQRSHGSKPLIRASVWEIFEKKPNEKDIVVCKLCKKKGTKLELKCKNSNTSTMRNHAKSFHKQEFQKAEDNYNKATQSPASVKDNFKSPLSAPKYKLRSQVIWLFKIMSEMIVQIKPMCVTLFLNWYFRKRNCSWRWTKISQVCCLENFQEERRKSRQGYLRIVREK